MARVLRGLALARRVRATDGAERNAELISLDEVTRWLAARAADAPQNFLHLLCLVEVDRAWAVGDFQGCVRGFDAALREAWPISAEHAKLIRARCAHRCGRWWCGPRRAAARR
jgi:hypothetical protein